MCELRNHGDFSIDIFSLFSTVRAIEQLFHVENF